MTLVGWISLLIVSAIINICFYRWDRRSASVANPNYIPDYGVTPELVAEVPSLITRYAVEEPCPKGLLQNLPREVSVFFSKYRRLELNDNALEVDRRFLAEPYEANLDFVKIAMINEEDVVLVRKDESDGRVFVVGCEDSDPRHPELFATSFDKFIACVYGYSCTNDGENGKGK